MGGRISLHETLGYFETREGLLKKEKTPQIHENESIGAIIVLEDDLQRRRCASLTHRVGVDGNEGGLANVDIYDTRLLD